MAITWSAVLHGAPLHAPQSPVDELVAVRKPGLVQLRAEVVVIEDESGSVKQPEEEADGPEEVGRIAALDDGEATAAGSPSGSDGAWRRTSRGTRGRRTTLDPPGA